MLVPSARKLLSLSGYLEAGQLSVVLSYSLFLSVKEVNTSNELIIHCFGEDDVQRNNCHQFILFFFITYFFVIETYIDFSETAS